MTDQNLINEDGTENTVAPAADTTEAPQVAIPHVKIGTFVTYISGKGKQKAALVLGTPETIEEGTNLGFTLHPGQLTLKVFSPSGGVEDKKHVDFAGLKADGESAPVRVWQPTE